MPQAIPLDMLSITISIILHILKFSINAIRQHVFVFVWLLPLSATIFRFMHVTGYKSVVQSFLLLNSILVHILPEFIYSPIDEHFGCFQS